MISCPVPIAVISEANQSWHENRFARGARVKAQREAVRVYLRSKLSRLPKSEKLLPAKVTLIRIAARPLDTDNLARAFKAVRDEVAKVLGVDDGSPLVEWAYAQEKNTQPRQSEIRIELEPRPCPDVRVRYDDGTEAEFPAITLAQYEPDASLGSGVDRALRRHGLQPISTFPEGLRLLLDLGERDKHGKRVFRYATLLGRAS